MKYLLQTNAILENHHSTKTLRSRLKEWTEETLTAICGKLHSFSIVDWARTPQTDISDADGSTGTKYKTLMKNKDKALQQYNPSRTVGSLLEFKMIDNKSKKGDEGNP